MTNNHHLSIRNVTISFGKLTALNDVSLHLNRGEILGLIGPNGAGKTTLINSISGFYRPQKGEIIFKDRDLIKTAVHSIADLGISRTFQNIELYTGLTTLENLMAARHMMFDYGVLAGVLFFGKAIGCVHGTRRFGTSRD